MSSIPLTAFLSSTPVAVRGSLTQSSNFLFQPRNCYCASRGSRRRAVILSAGPEDEASDSSSETSSSQSRRGPIDSISAFLSGISRVAGLGSQKDDERLLELEDVGLFDDSEGEPPVVLVAGATGQTGQIIVRKLLLRGYRVRVLVRNLYSSTLDLLGTGVTFAKGDIRDYESLLECVGDVDKVICALGANNDQSPEDVDFKGVGNLIRAFHDGRVQYYGRSEATKVRLFDFSRDNDMEKWRCIPPSPGSDGRYPLKVSFDGAPGGRKVFMGVIYAKYTGVAEMRTVPAKINLSGFSGLILRYIGNGKPYRFILRTAEGVRESVEFVSTFSSKKNVWETVRLPISSFAAYDVDSGALCRDATPINRADIRQMAIQYAKPEIHPERDDGKFYLGIDYIKIYRTQDEPDFVLVSCASVARTDLPSLDEGGLRSIAAEDATAWKYMAEKRLRNSGLTYCIVRPGAFTDQPGGRKSLVLEQDSDEAGVISRADLAEICVSALLDPRACNVTFEAFESIYAPTAQIPNQEMSTLLGRLKPNT